MARYDGPIVDVDIHHSVNSDTDLLSYLPTRWRRYVEGNGRELFSIYNPPGGPPNAFIPNRGRLGDAYPEDGTRSGASYQLLCEQLLDKHNVWRALLTHQLGDSPTHLNHYYAAAVCRAVNDWNLETWLDRDERLYSVVMVPSQVPNEAAAEIRRVGRHPRMAGVILAGNTLGRPLGDPLYDPIHEAAAELELPLVIHISNCDRPNNQIGSVGGRKPTVMESVSESGQACAHYISSFVINGTFEKYPRLRVLFNEYGVSWLPQIVWRLDQNYDVLRFESSWVKRWPSEYIVSNVRFSTQPIEESPDDKLGLAKFLETVDGAEEMLCYSSDYPHVSFDDPDYVKRLLPTQWHRKVFCDNACALFGWERPALQLERSATVAG